QRTPARQSAGLPRGRLWLALHRPPDPDTRAPEVYTATAKHGALQARQADLQVGPPRTERDHVVAGSEPAISPLADVDARGGLDQARWLDRARAGLYLLDGFGFVASTPDRLRFLAPYRELSKRCAPVYGNLSITCCRFLYVGVCGERIMETLHHHILGAQ